MVRGNASRNAAMARSTANSARCATLSPSPRMPPQQTSMPESRTISSVENRSSHVCVVTTCGKKERAVSRLWLYRWMPIVTSSSTCAWLSIPSDAAIWMSTSARIAATPSRICLISRSSGPRTAATMQNSVAPVAAVCRAAATSGGQLLVWQLQDGEHVGLGQPHAGLQDPVDGGGQGGVGQRRHGPYPTRTVGGETWSRLPQTGWPAWPTRLTCEPAPGYAAD